MAPIDIAAIERRARQLRAEEMQRLQGVFAERLGLYGRLLAGSLWALLVFLGEALRPLFSWNPQSFARRHPRPALLTRLNRIARRLFAWNPGHHRTC